ncbi:hypothetical protein [Bacillus sp. AG4(2022)]|uniref:hypothetical protein n=1 Tax=Bacillus sp. AG4(2022) TaxID=2962594 RepID=UPI002881F2DB|nr:hypothetical protein [Bacillus sp. AG4(2022)]MDT0163600.1 hypothetical protein [Bacillus sp. AG4(2022)]
MKKFIFAIPLVFTLGFGGIAQAAMLDDDTQKIYINGSSTDYGTGTSRISDMTNGTILALGTTTYIGASSVYVKVEAGVDGSYAQPVIKSSSSDSVGGSVNLGPKKTSSNFHVYSTHKIYKNGSLVGSTSTKANW